MDRPTVDKYLNKHPKLINFIDAGTISLKMAREILDVDRWYMQEMFNELVVAGAVNAMGNSSWRATTDLKEYLSVLREKERVT